MMAITTGMQYTTNSTLPITGHDQTSPHGQPSNRELTRGERQALEATSSDFLADKVTCKYNLDSIRDEIMTNLKAIQGLSQECLKTLKERGIEATPLDENQIYILLWLTALPFTFFVGRLLGNTYNRFASRQPANQETQEAHDLLPS